MKPITVQELLKYIKQRLKEGSLEPDSLVQSVSSVDVDNKQYKVEDIDLLFLHRIGKKLILSDQTYTDKILFDIQ